MTRHIFAKVDANLDSHPKVIEAGFWGSTVFQFILRVNWMRGCDGHVPSRYVTTRSVTRSLMLDECESDLKVSPAEIVERGIRAALDAGLIDKSECDGVECFSIVGWDNAWKGAKSDAERKRRQRDRGRHAPSREVTTGHDKSREVTDVTTIEGEGEGEKKRERERATGRALALAGIEALRDRTGGRFDPRGKVAVENCTRLAKAGYSPEDVRAVVEAKCREWLKDERMQRQLKPSVLFRPSNFRKYLEEDVPTSAASPSRGQMAPETPPENVIDEFQFD